MLTHNDIKQDHDMHLTFLCYPKGKPPLSDENKLGKELYKDLVRGVISG